MTRYRSGYAKERGARKRLERSARLVVRSAGSKGPVDLVAFYGILIYAVQVKFCKPGRAWRDANWKKLVALELPENVVKVAYVYRRGTTEPEVYSA